MDLSLVPSRKSMTACLIGTDQLNHKVCPHHVSVTVCTLSVVCPVRSVCEHQLYLLA